MTLIFIEILDEKSLLYNDFVPSITHGHNY